jgi:hypothetical protein
MSQPQADTLYCANHPNRETLLRCNRCEKPICLDCAVQTDVGYRCRECIGQQRAKYYNAQGYDLPLGAVTGLILGAIAGALAYAFLGRLGFFSFLIAFFLGPAIGGGIAEAIRRVLRKRRAPGMKITGAIACAAGILLGGVVLFLLGGASLPVAVIAAVTRLPVLLLGFLAASTVYARIL